MAYVLFGILSINFGKMFNQNDTTIESHGGPRGAAASLLLQFNTAMMHRKARSKMEPGRIPQGTLLDQETRSWRSIFQDSASTVTTTFPVCGKVFHLNRYLTESGGRGLTLVYAELQNDARDLEYLLLFRPNDSRWI